MYIAVLIFKKANNRCMQNFKTIFIIVVEVNLKLNFKFIKQKIAICYYGTNIYFKKKTFINYIISLFFSYNKKENNLVVNS